LGLGGGEAFEEVAARRIQKVAKAKVVRLKTRKLLSAVAIQRAYRRYRQRRAKGHAPGATLQTMVRNLVVSASLVDNLIHQVAKDWLPHW
jgi:ribosome assembly protein YihI (activator of Der GTPase)